MYPSFGMWEENESEEEKAIQLCYMRKSLQRHKKEEKRKRREKSCWRMIEWKWMGFYGKRDSQERKDGNKILSTESRSEQILFLKWIQESIDFFQWRRRKEFFRNRNGVRDQKRNETRVKKYERKKQRDREKGKQREKRWMEWKWIKDALFMRTRFNVCSFSLSSHSISSRSLSLYFSSLSSHSLS